MTPTVPNDYGELLETFGNAPAYLERKDEWERLILAYAALPTSLPYAYVPGVEITRIRAHRLLVRCFVETIEECLDLGVERDALTYGGIYSFRSMRHRPRLSTHAWGIAIDLDPARNQRGSRGVVPPEMLHAFTRRGFVWGGHWTTPDPMHWQYVRSY